MLHQLKLFLLKTIDLTALGFLEPVVRLCYGEDPRKQLKLIGQFVLIPVIAMVVFTLVWAYGVSPRVKTKSGELPSPGVVWSSATALDRFADRENSKESAYLATGEDREAWLAQAKAQLAEVEPKILIANEKLIAARAQESADKQERIAPLQSKVDEMEALLKAEQKAQEDQLKIDAETLPVGQNAQRDAYLGKLAGLTVWIDAQKAEISLIDDKIKAILDEKDGLVLRALMAQTAAAEEKQYLTKMIDQLSENNRETKVAEGQAKVDEAKAEFAAAEGAAAFKLAKRVVSAEERLVKTADSDYAKPTTLYFQIRRSILCVFTGFMLGTLIAVPIGILCGLSKTFMAAMTPFIALFKPVSPIVWLPIALIVASAIIPNEHWLLQWLWELPLIGQYKINPAFLASAVTVALCSLWATMTNTALGVASVDKDHLNVAKVLRLGFFARLFKIVLPSALPLVFAGLRISLGVGWMVLIAAELLASSEGIGKFVWDQFNNGAADSFAKMMVVVFVVGIIGLFLDRIMIIFQRLVSFEGSVAAI